MLDIMTGMDHLAWFAGILRCPSRCAPLVVSGPRCPSSWPAWTTGQYGGSQVQLLDKVFYMPVIVLRVVPRSRQCSAVHCLAFPLLQFITVVDTPCHYAEADPHGPGCSDDHCDLTVAAH